MIVWDPVLRLLHWSLVFFVAAAFAARDGTGPTHQYAGFVVLAIVGLRLLWGFIGPRHARFAEFVRPAPEVMAYVGRLARGRPDRYLGHSPLAGAMVVALLVVLLLTGGTGALAATEAAAAAQAAVIHTASANLLLVLVLVQAILGFVVGVVHGDQPFRAMINGRKRE